MSAPSSEDSSQSDATWLDEFKGRTRRALGAAQSFGDRLALIRELARLSEDRLDLDAEGVRLTSREEANLARFGMARTGSGSWVRLLEIETDLVTELSRSLPLDTGNRRLFAPVVADAFLLRLSAHNAYQSATQKAAVRALLTMPDASALMVSMPTGSGKSLLFQIGPRFWREKEPGACVVVITPTVALAEDHQRTLRKMPGLEQSCALTGATRGVARQTILNDFRQGKVPVLFLSPEAALNGEVKAALIDAAKPSDEKFGLAARLMAIFVDEAHLVEQWGRTFRPDFQRLPALVQQLRQAHPALRVVLLSATLNPSSRLELRREYGAGPWLEIHASTPRYEIDLLTRAFDDTALRDEALLRLVDRLPRPAILYTTRVEAAASLHATLKSRGYQRLSLFTGEISDGQVRRQIVQGWADDEFDLIVATSAFGLGVDKADVRAVVHACLPENAARWYQEVGRASRDGHQGLGVCLWTTRAVGRRADERDAFRFSSSSWLTRKLGVARWRALRDAANLSWTPDGARRMALDLDAAHDDLRGPTGAPNRRWNLSLLNLMQRAGALTVTLLTDEGETPVRCEVELHQLELLENGTDADTAMTRIFWSRDQEQRASIAEYNGFRTLMLGGADTCLLTGVFLQIEPDVVQAPPCGRCPHCRAHNIAPPTTAHPEGVDRCWDPWEDDGKNGRQILVAPDHLALNDEFDRLVRRLLNAGVEQFLVPEHLAQRAAKSALAHGAELGLVLTLEDCLDQGWRLPGLTTAMIHTRQGPPIAECMALARGFLADGESRVIYVVADPHERLEQRQLSQHFLLAYAEAALPRASVAQQVSRTVGA